MSKTRKGGGNKQIIVFNRILLQNYNSVQYFLKFFNLQQIILFKTYFNFIFYIKNTLNFKCDI
jgi:hypothetical protein